MKNKVKKPELLAPAGSLEILTYALRYGADAVYVGGKDFSMRAAPKNFDEEELRLAVKLCHENDKKLYLTCNILAHNREIELLPAYLEQVADAGVDALIVSDLGVLELAKKHAPKAEIHISTQAGVVNYATANMLYNMGASRVVLARELPLEEIAEIRQKTSKELEIEAFVHGAMCVSFSGRCLLSNYIVGRDANRGECAQPCRWGYYLMEEKRPGEYYPIYEDEKGSHILNAKDMCMIEHLGDLASAGISSFKIEGRAKTEYYVAVVTNGYRTAIDSLFKGVSVPQWAVDEMVKVSHREYSTGFYFGTPENSQCYKDGGYIREWDFVGVVHCCKGDTLSSVQRNKFAVGDVLEIVHPGSEPQEIKVLAMWDEEGNAIESCPHPMMKVTIKADRTCHCSQGDILRKGRE